MDIRRVLLLGALWTTGVVLMFFALFVETAASSSNDYRFGMSLGLLLAGVADAVLYWVFSNGRMPAKVAALFVGMPATLFIPLDWSFRAPSVFSR